MHGSQMSLEDIGTVEALLGRATTTRAETAHHGAFVVGEGVSVLVVFTSESLDVVFARRDRAFLRAFVLVCEHMRLEVLDMSAAGGDRAEAFVRVV